MHNLFSNHRCRVLVCVCWRPLVLKEYTCVYVGMCVFVSCVDVYASVCVHASVCRERGRGERENVWVNTDE